MTCDTCKFWFLDTDNYGEDAPNGGMFKDEKIPGMCQRHAPQPARISTKEALREDGNGWPITRWPETKYFEWCGEWESKIQDDERNGVIERNHNAESTEENQDEQEQAARKVIGQEGLKAE